MTHDEIYLPRGDVLLAMIPLAYYLGMPKTLIKIWRWISHTATAVFVLGWWHTISTAIVVSAAVLTAWLREQDPIILFVVGLGAFTAMVIIFERLAAWRYRKQSSVTEKIEEPWRITLIDLAREAEKRGWKILDSKSLHVLDFLDGIRQSGADGTLIIYGKRIHTFPQLTRTELFVPIPKDHWPSHQIDLYSFCEYRADRSSAYSKDNFQTHVKGLTSADGGKSFADIHLDRTEALTWLKTDALAHRGQREKHNGNR